MSNHGLFEVLAGEDASEQERISGTRAVIAAQTRAKERFEKYVSKAKTQDERDARITAISSNLDEILASIADEYGVEDIENLRNAATVALGGGHPSGCTCGFCKNKGKLPGAKKDDDGDDDADDKSDSKSDDDGDKDDDDDDDDDKGSKKPWESKVDVRQTTASAAPYDWERVASFTVEADGFSFCKCDCEGCDSGSHCESEKCIESKHSGNPGNPESAGSSEKTSAEVETGDTFTTERVDLPSNSTDGLGGPSPKIDKGNSGDNLGWSTPKIDVPSAQHPVERQQIHQTPEYKADLPGVSETGKEIDADTPLTGDPVAPNTETWTGTEGQADPVTSAVLAKWSILG